MNPNFEQIGTATAVSRSPKNYTVYLFKDNEGFFYIYDDVQKFLTAQVHHSMMIDRFISRTTFYGLQDSITFLFVTPEEKVLQQILHKRFQEKEDESFISFIRFFEDNNFIVKLFPFRFCRAITQRILLSNFEKYYCYGKTSKKDDTTYYLVTGHFPQSNDLDFPGDHKLFLQIVYNYGHYIEHEELTPLLYAFAQHPELIKFLQTEIES